MKKSDIFKLNQKSIKKEHSFINEKEEKNKKNSEILAKTFDVLLNTKPKPVCYKTLIKNQNLSSCVFKKFAAFFLKKKRSD